MIQGKELIQYDFTPQQYQALIKLTATLCKVLPKIKCDYPKDAAGQLIRQKLPDAELEAYQGVLGHFHIQTDKVDPGPAFQWDYVIGHARRHPPRRHVPDGGRDQQGAHAGEVKKLFLLDGMALVYRAHFAFISRPILTSKGVNTSALYGFTQTLLDILKNQQPTHIAVAFDTAAPTQRHTEFADYKANRQEMPEDLSAALPHVRRMVEALQYPGAHLRRLRGRRHHRHAGAARREGRLPVLHGHVRQRLRPARHREHLHLQALAERRAAWRSSACPRFRAAGACSGPSKWWMCWR